MSHVHNMNFPTFYEIDLIPIKYFFSKTVIIAGERDNVTLNSSHEAFGISAYGSITEAQQISKIQFLKKKSQKPGIFTGKFL